jgi:hypothetical protein
MLDLYRMQNNVWAVKTLRTGVSVFPSIEEASEFMLNLGIYDDEIDVALIDIVTMNHTRARFGISGVFISSDDKRAFE